MASRMASISSMMRSEARFMPSARSSADSRVRSITDSPRVLATPTRAMVTATASRPVTTSRITSSTVLIRSASSAPPPIATGELIRMGTSSDCISAIWPRSLALIQ
ncbi:Uncharacterised protein [Mycobacteroides abscessus subsp. abscessus]|nr:Uncharacterised protein [Mycobacteroides abscessus subsp. abscessus]